MGCRASIPSPEAVAPTNKHNERYPGISNPEAVAPTNKHNERYPGISNPEAVAPTNKHNGRYPDISNPEAVAPTSKHNGRYPDISKPEAVAPTNKQNGHYPDISNPQAVAPANNRNELYSSVPVRGDPLRQGRHKNIEATPYESFAMNDVFVNGDQTGEETVKGTSFENIVNICPQPPQMKNMEDIQNKEFIFMIKPWKYDSSRPDREPKPINNENGYVDLWDENHVRMPCSSKYIDKDKRTIWSHICQWLQHLKAKCDNHEAKFGDLRVTIETCSGFQYDMGCLEKLITKIYSEEERTQFMHITLSKMCDLVLTLDIVCTQPPPLLHTASNRAVTMSQRQAASLLACAFFCLFPNRSRETHRKEYENYQNPNFDSLYHNGPPQKAEKLKCILHYFQRVTNNMPNGVITFRRFELPNNLFPPWSDSKADLCDLHATTGKKIEEVNNTLQVDFANKYIGGGVLGNGCVQEEIRFTICPEMLVSLLVCDRMEVNECIFLIGCERYSSYRGYSGSFQFAGNYDDHTPKDNWGRKWCHLVAMDAICFRDPPTQYHIKNVDRELLKAYTSFRPLGKGSDYEFGITTGNWGCGAFNGDRQLKAIIQLMAASEAGRPLIYAAYGDKKLVDSFFEIYNYLTKQNATVADLYHYLHRYSDRHNKLSLFEYILKKPVSSLRS